MKKQQIRLAKRKGLNEKFLKVQMAYKAGDKETTTITERGVKW